MPYLVIPEKKDSDVKDTLPPVRRNWMVAWVLLPYFLAANSNLIKRVDQRLSDLYKGRVVVPGDPNLQREMSSTVIDTIVSEVPISGLREVLEAISAMDANETDTRLPA